MANSTTDLFSLNLYSESVREQLFQAPYWTQVEPILSSIQDYDAFQRARLEFNCPSSPPLTINFDATLDTVEHRHTDADDLCSSALLELWFHSPSPLKLFDHLRPSCPDRRLHLPEILITGDTIHSPITDQPLHFALEWV